jgi:hypothetical protein
MLGNGSTEVQPQMAHSCSTLGFAYADPAVRIQQWTAAFGPNGFFGSICADDFGPTITSIAQQMVGP